MGATRFSGPVYGAKSNLLTLAYAAGAISSNASTTLVPGSAFIVPNYEAWIVTGLFPTVSTCSSLAASIKLKVEYPAFGAASSGSTTILSVNSGTSTSIGSTWVIATTSPGEYEGFFCPPNSTLRFVSSATSPMGITNLNLHGFIRFVNSSRAEP
jgi:hypothetical protein